MHEWSVVPLRSIADIRVSNVDKKATSGEARVRLCNYMDVYTKDYIRADMSFMEATASASEIQRFGVQRGDVMITKDSETPDDIGIPAVVTEDVENLVCGYHLAQIRPNCSSVDSVYLAKQLATSETVSYFAQRAAGSTRYGLSNRTIAEVPIRLAPLAQQKRIAAILIGLDDAIEATEALIEKQKQIKLGLMHDLFSRGVLANGQLRPPKELAPEQYQLTRLGWLPREWRSSSCGETFSIDSGITLGPHRRPAKRAHPYLRVANVRRGELRLDDVAMLEALPAEMDYVLKVFDLLVVEGHASTEQIGRCAMVQDDAEGMLFQNHLFRLRAIGMSPHFALLWMNSHHVRRYWLRACATSSGLNTINRKMLNAVPVFVPDMNEQTRISGVASTASARIESERHLLDKLRRQKLGLMQDLLTGKVSVKITEAAEALF